jgi:hypothetical protein
MMRAQVAPSAQVLSKTPIKTVICKAAVLFLIAIVCGIVFYLLEGGALLPTISNTWTSPPASYISRYCVGTGCLFFYVGNVVIYRANQDIGPFAQKSCVNKLCLFVSALAIFCLSWVGSICDSSKDTCRGINSVHLAFAIPFFILYNMYMCILTCRLGKKAHHSVKVMKKMKASIILLLALSLISKLRFVPASNADGFISPFLLDDDSNTSMTMLTQLTGDNDLVALFEWTDVASIVLWTLIYVSHRAPAFSLATIQLGDGACNGRLPIIADGNIQVLNRISGYTLSIISAVLLFFLLVISFVVEVFVTGDVPMPVVFGGNASWPDESALWVSAPGNWMARWALVAAGTLLMGYNSLISRTLGTSKGAKTTGCISSLVGTVGCCGLALSGCVDQFEDKDEHDYFMSVTFFAFNLLATMLSIFHIVHDQKRRCVWGLFVLFICGTLSRYFIDTADIDDDSTDVVDIATISILNILEWMNTVILLLFICFYTWVKQLDFQKLAIAITFTNPSLSKKKLHATDSPVLAYVSTSANGEKSFDEGNQKSDGTIVTARLIS